MPKLPTNSPDFLSKSPLLFMNLIFACLLTACQSLPNPGQESALVEVPLDTISTEALQTQPLTEEKQVRSEQMPEVAEQLQEVIASLPDPEPEHIWDRMRDQYKLSIPSNPRLTRELNWYKKHPKYLQRI
ncbi:MAG: hypothetical protein ABW107_03250, partial [Candidatus Thiodiazotropha sp. 6PLUC5]